MTCPPTRWMFHDTVLLWIFPATYGFHLIEEWAAASPVLLWRARLDPPLGALSFVVPNVVALALMILGVYLVGRGARFHWIVPALATAVLLNTVGHVVGSAVAGQYSAGLATAVIFWMPLGALTLLRVAFQASAKTLWAGVSVGILIEIVVLATVAALG